MLVVVRLIKPFPVALCTISWAGVTANRDWLGSLTQAHTFMVLPMHLYWEKKLNYCRPKKTVICWILRSVVPWPPTARTWGGSQKNPISVQYAGEVQSSLTCSRKAENRQGIKDKEKKHHSILPASGFLLHSDQQRKAANVQGGISTGDAWFTVQGNAVSLTYCISLLAGGPPVRREEWTSQGGATPHSQWKCFLLRTFAWKHF